MIKYGETEIYQQPFPMEIYDKDGNIIHIFSAETKQIRDEFMDSFYITMNANKIHILCDGYLHFRNDDKMLEKIIFCINSGIFDCI